MEAESASNGENNRKRDAADNYNDDNKGSNKKIVNSNEGQSKPKRKMKTHFQQEGMKKEISDQLKIKWLEKKKVRTGDRKCLDYRRCQIEKSMEVKREKRRSVLKRSKKNHKFVPRRCYCFDPQSCQRESMEQDSRFQGKRPFLIS